MRFTCIIGLVFLGCLQTQAQELESFAEGCVPHAAISAFVACTMCQTPIATCPSSPCTTAACLTAATTTCTATTAPSNGFNCMASGGSQCFIPGPGNTAGTIDCTACTFPDVNVATTCTSNGQAVPNNGFNCMAPGGSTCFIPGPGNTAGEITCGTCTFPAVNTAFVPPTGTTCQATGVAGTTNSGFNCIGEGGGTCFIPGPLNTAGLIWCLTCPFAASASPTGASCVGTGTPATGTLTTDGYNLIIPSTTTGTITCFIPGPANTIATISCT